MKILIVDDSRAMRLIIGRALREMDLPDTTYAEASDGNAALTAIQDLHPEVVISDFNMPGMSGMELLRAIKTNGITTRFGFVTSEASSQLHQEAEEAGALFVITKPFTAANLNQTLSPVLAGLGCGTFDTGEGSTAVYTGASANFPNPAQIASLLKELLRRNVTASAAPPIHLPPPAGHIVVEYQRGEDGVVIGCGICDISCAVRMGAALTLIPAAAAAEAIATRQLTDAVGENFHEVLNVISRLFDIGGKSRVCLGQVHRPGEPLSGELAARIAKPASRIDACIDIAGYGKGNLTLLALR